MAANQNQYSSHDLQRYRAQAAKVAEARSEVNRQVEQFKENGGTPDAVHDALQELNLRTKEFEALRQNVGPNVTFLAGYGVEVTGDQTVSFVIPAGVSPITILEQAQELMHGSPTELIKPSQLAEWGKDPRFTKTQECTVKYHIDGAVKGSSLLYRSAQEKLVSKKALRMPQLEELAVAVAVYSVASNESLLGYSWGHGSASNYRLVNIARAVDGALTFESRGLIEKEIDDTDGWARTAAAVLSHTVLK